MFYFNKGIDKHFINATAGLNVQESHSKTTAIEYRGFQLSNLNSPTYAAEQTRKSAVSSDKSRLLVCWLLLTILTTTCICWTLLSVWTVLLSSARTRDSLLSGLWVPV